MKSSILLTLNILFAMVVLATPHRHHQYHHHARKAKREDEGTVVWVTELVSVVETVQVTSTVWVKPSYPEPTLSTEIMNAKPTPKSAVEAPIPDEFHEKSAALIQTPHEVAPIAKPINENMPHLPESQVSPDAPETNSLEPDHQQDEAVAHSPLASTPQSSPPIKIINNESSPATKVINNELSPPSDIPNPVSPTEKSETEPQTSQPESSPSQDQSPPEHGPEAHNVTPNKYSYGPSNERCSSSSPCSGDITYYDPGVGYGACGWMSTKNEPVVALPHEFMGLKSNGNKYCGKTITIEHNGKLSTARVVDKCMGCSGFSIDLSDAAFTKLSSLSVGRTGARWWINP